MKEDKINDLLIFAGQKGIVTRVDNTATGRNTVTNLKAYDNLPERHPATGALIDKEAYYDELVNGEKNNGNVVKPRTFYESYLYNTSEKRGIPFDTFKDSFNDFAKWISTVESRMDNNARPDIKGNTARGFFQFNNDSIDTSRQRFRNVAKRDGIKPNENIQKYVDGELDITDLNYKDQKTVFTVNFTEDKYSTVADLIDSKNYKTQYAFHHKDPAVIDYYKKNNVIDLSLADDKNINTNLLAVDFKGYKTREPKNDVIYDTIEGLATGGMLMYSNEFNIKNIKHV